MTIDDLSRQLKCALSAEMYDKAKEIIKQIKQDKDYINLDNQRVNTLIIRSEVEKAELLINNLTKY